MIKFLFHFLQKFSYIYNKYSFSIFSVLLVFFFFLFVFLSIFFIVFFCSKIVDIFWDFFKYMHQRYLMFSSPELFLLVLKLKLKKKVTPRRFAYVRRRWMRLYFKLLSFRGKSKIFLLECFLAGYCVILAFFDRIFFEEDREVLESGLSRSEPAEQYEEDDLFEIMESFYGENDLIEEDSFEFEFGSREHLIRAPVDHIVEELEDVELPSVLFHESFEHYFIMVGNAFIEPSAVFDENNDMDFTTNNPLEDGFSEIFIAPSSDDPALLEKVFMSSDVPEELMFLRFGESGDDLSTGNFFFYRQIINLRLVFFQPLLRFFLSLIPSFLTNFFYFMNLKSSGFYSFLFPIIYLCFLILELLKLFCFFVFICLFFFVFFFILYFSFNFMFFSV